MPEMRVDEIFISGGGTHNPTLIGMLQKAMEPIAILETSEAGLDVDAKEAVAFAVLAYESSHHRASNVPKATGAKRSVVLGKVTPNGPNRPESSNGEGRNSNGSVAHKTAGDSAQKDSRSALTANRNGASHKARPTVKNTMARQATQSKVKAAAR